MAHWSLHKIEEFEALDIDLQNRLTAAYRSWHQAQAVESYAAEKKVEAEMRASRHRYSG